MIPEFAEALAASKRAKKLMQETDRLIAEAEACSTSRGVDAHDRRRRIQSIGDALASSKAAQAAALVASESMQAAFNEWKNVR